MASVTSRRGWVAFGAFLLWISRLAVVLALVGLWTALELRAASQRVTADLSSAATIAKGAVGTLLTNFSKVAGAFSAASLTHPNRIALAAHLLRLDPLVQPAHGLFLYDANGRFVAATEPLSPDGRTVTTRFWFQDALAQPTVPAPLLSNFTKDPLTGTEGYLLTHAIAGDHGRPVGVIGSFLKPSALHSLLVPPILTRPASITLTRADGTTKIWAIHPPPHRPMTPERKLLEHGIYRLLRILGWSPIVNVSAPLPDHLIWQARLDFVAGLTWRERSDLVWHGGLLALGAIVLAFLVRVPAGWRRSRPIETGTPALAPELDVEWIWEIDQRGLLVGVAGNAPESLVAAVGADFLAMADGTQQASVLRGALIRREPIANLDLALTLPSSAGGARRRFRLNGRPVAETGGMWGSAREILSEPGSSRGRTNRVPEAALKMSG